MKRKNLYFLVAIIIIIVPACEKDPIVSMDNSSCNEILTFIDENEFQAELDKVLNMSSDELDVWEKEKGFNSFGVMAERLYRSINPDQFETINEVKSFVQSNNKYLELVEDDEGELYLETKLNSSNGRYFINEDKLFQIGNNVYKLFEGGKAMTKIESLEELKDIDNINEAQMLSNIFYISKTKLKSIHKDLGSTCSEDPFFDRVNVEREKIKLTIETDYLIFGSGEDMEIEYELSYLARPYKRTLGIWYWVDSRNITGNINASLRYINKDDRDDYLNFINEDIAINNASKSEASKSTGKIPFANGEDGGELYAVDSWAKQDKCSEKVELKCNKDAFIYEGLE